ncbi:unnamed protein product, partial [marine sediment metagenome]
MLNALSTDFVQIPLIHIVDKDDIILLESPDAEWFNILYHFPWQEYRSFGAEYYDALYKFNSRKQQEQINKQKDKVVETKDEAKIRLLFDRTTMKDIEEEKKSNIIYQGEIKEIELLKVNPDNISQGIVPIRLAG